MIAVENHVQSNPQLANMTVGDFKQWAAQKGGGAGGGYQPPTMDGIPQVTGPKFTLPPRDVMAALFRSPDTRDIAISLAKGAQQGMDAQTLQTFQRPDGSIWQFNPATGEIGVVQDALDRQVKQAQLDATLAKPSAPTDDIREYNYARQQGYAGTFADWQTMKKSGTNVTVSNTETPQFFKTLDENSAKTFSGLIDSGYQAQANDMRINQLEAELAKAPQGIGGSLVQMAGNLGIPVQGLDEVQAAQALISQLVPAQRTPGSGTMSDGDVALFKASLPAIANQPGGNAKIIETIKAINSYTIAQGEIANKVANREISPTEGRKQLMALPNPLAGLRNGSGEPQPTAPNPASTANTSPAPVQINDDAGYNALPSGTTFIAPDGTIRKKP